MAQDQISQLFNIQEIEANAQQALDVVRQKVVEINKLQEQILKSDSASSNNSNTKAASASLNELSLNIKLYNDLLKQNEILTAKMNVMTSEAAKAQLELKQKMSETSKEARLESVASNELASAYERLNAQHKLAVLSYQNLAASGKASAAQLSAQKDAANALGDQLAKIDQATGNYRRNVGNYSSAWNGLGNSINQITREMPNFAQSFQLGVLAISNNLPILQDEIIKTKTQIAALKAEGKEAPSLFSQIGASIFSWQTALTIGVTLLVSYSKEIADFFSGITESEKRFNEENKRLYKERKDAAEQAITNASKEQASLDILYKTATDVNQSYELRVQSVKKLQEQYPNYFANLSQEAILAGNAAAQYKELAGAIMTRASIEVYKTELNQLTEKSRKAEKEIEFQKQLLEFDDKRTKELIKQDVNYNS
jgi:hypothetical protein